jgi:alpha-glucosidase
MEVNVGTWGSGPFDSDTALDFLSTVSSVSSNERMALISRIFDSAVEGANLTTPIVTPEEVLAAAAVVAANSPGGEVVSWGEEAIGISQWLPKPVSVALATSALDALEASIPADGWWWSSWQNDSDRARMQDAIERIRRLLRRPDSQ